jgi:hypothetical protein
VVQIAVKVPVFVLVRVLVFVIVPVIVAVIVTMRCGGHRCRLVTEATAASHEVGRASECYEHRGYRAVWLLRTRLGLAVSS